MTTNNLLKKLKRILKTDRQEQLAKYASLKKVLKLLRIEKSRLQEELEQSTDKEASQEIDSRLKIISAQRKKGLKVLKELKKERE